MAETVALDLLGAQMGRLLVGQAATRDDIRELVRAMVSQHHRFYDRVCQLEEHPAE